MKQAETQRDAASDTVTARLPETWQWLLVPVQEAPQDAVKWQATRLSGRAGLAARAATRLINDELLITSFSGTRLRMELDRVPLWRGDHVAVKQMVEDFARYTYLPRMQSPAVLLGAVAAGVSLLTWERDGFALADSYDEQAKRYVGLRSGMLVALPDASASDLLVKPDVAAAQLDAERVPVPGPLGEGPNDDGGGFQPGPPGTPPPPPQPPQPTRFHGNVSLDATRAGRDASQITDEVVAHLTGLPRARVTVTLEIHAELPEGAPDHVVRTVTENSRTLKFTSHGFERE